MTARRPWALGAGLACVALVAACTGGGDDGAGSTPATPATVATTVAPPTTLLVVAVAAPEVAGAEVQVADDRPAALAPEVRDAIAERVRRYVEVAMVGPLTTGSAATGLDELLAPAALDALTPGRRAVLVDEGLGRVVRLDMAPASVTLTALAGPDGAPVVVAAELDVAVDATGADGQEVRVHRSGTLTFERTGGAWMVAEFSLQVERQVGP